MTSQDLFDKLWEDYSARTPSAKKIKTLFSNHGNAVLNDHIAFRTFNDSRINIDVLATAFIACGYEKKDVYYFEEKKLKAYHFEHLTDKDAPLVFISELLLEEFSMELQTTVKSILDQVDFSTVTPENLVHEGRLWSKPSYETYMKLLNESEYAAWLYVNGFCANHFTVNVNKLEQFDSLEAVNTFLKDNQYELNNSGGEIKGNPELFLEQSSILADKINVEFQEGTYEITSCYYEFAYRYEINGQLFRGFVANSADKIFESTDMVMH